MGIKRVSMCLVSIIALAGLVSSQQTPKDSQSIGGPEHASEIYGVTIGMDVPTALEAVFVNAGRSPGQEKPDALRKEGKGGKDIRVLYKDLPKGEVQIVFAGGMYVKEVSLLYKVPPLLDDLRLPFSSTIGSTRDTANETSVTGVGAQSPAVLDGTSIEEFSATKTVGNEKLSARRVGNISRSQSDLLDGTRYDDRYSIGFADNLKQQKIWWRDEKTDRGYRLKVAFIGKKLTESGAKFVASIVQKTIAVTPGDEDDFKSETAKAEQLQ